jgi:hypothetical protein
MTKKDYNLLAAVFRNVRGIIHVSAHEEALVEAIQDELCRLLKADNPRFDKKRFKYFCNLGRK